MAEVGKVQKHSQAEIVGKGETSIEVTSQGVRKTDQSGLKTRF